MKTKEGMMPLIPVEDRYQLFVDVHKLISKHPDISSEKLGDMWALTVVMTHPFRDGNGRTARTIGYLTRDLEVNPEWSEESNFNTFTAGNDLVRNRMAETGKSEFMMIGYIPREQGSEPDYESWSDPNRCRELMLKIIHTPDEQYNDLYHRPYPV